MKICFGSDHRGYNLKEIIKEHFSHIDWLDVGTFDADTKVDYPEFARVVSEEVISGNVERGILICGSGIGMSVAANRHSGIYAALCWNNEVAQAAGEDDKANILVLPADFIDEELAIDIVHTWLSSDFKGGRYQERLNMIDK